MVRYQLLRRSSVRSVREFGKQHTHWTRDEHGESHRDEEHAHGAGIARIRNSPVSSRIVESIQSREFRRSGAHCEYRAIRRHTLGSYTWTPNSTCDEDPVLTGTAFCRIPERAIYDSHRASTLHYRAGSVARSHSPTDRAVDHD